jgi:hypothetical protein
MVTTSTPSEINDTTTMPAETTKYSSDYPLTTEETLTSYFSELYLMNSKDVDQAESSLLQRETQGIIKFIFNYITL